MSQVKHFDQLPYRPRRRILTWYADFQSWPVTQLGSYIQNRRKLSKFVATSTITSAAEQQVFDYDFKIRVFPN